MVQSCHTVAMPVEQMPVTVNWSAAESVPPAFVNQFLTQLGLQAGVTGVPDGIILYVGRLDPPLIPGDGALVRQRFVEAGSTLNVAPAGTFVLTRERAVELVEVLQTAIGQYDETTAARGVTGDAG